MLVIQIDLYIAVNRCFLLFNKMELHVFDHI